MKDLVKIPFDNEQRPTVMGRDPHEAQGIRSNHKDWFSRMREYGFAEGTDLYLIFERKYRWAAQHGSAAIPPKKSGTIIMRKKSVDCRKIGSLISTRG